MTEIEKREGLALGQLVLVDADQLERTIELVKSQAQELRRLRAHAIIPDRPLSPWNNPRSPDAVI